MSCPLCFLKDWTPRPSLAGFRLEANEFKYPSVEAN